MNGMNARGFVSIEAFLALLFAAGALAFLLPSLSARPSFLSVYKFQLAQDIAEVSLKNPRTYEEIADFAAGEERGRAFLEEKYSKILGGLGDYCLEVRAKERGLRVNCRREPSSEITVSRIFFDGKDFFDASFSLGFYS